MKASEFDKKFDKGENIVGHLDLSKARRPEQEQKRVNVDFPVWMIQLLDKEAKRLCAAPVHHQNMGGGAPSKGCLEEMTDKIGKYTSGVT